MPIDSVSAASEGSLHIEAYCLYAALTRTATTLAIAPKSELNLSGSLLYAGELDAHGSARVIAGNVAGCATLAATANQAMQKQAIRDGAVDFVVTSLDEALRILKNEIRKRATVAVCVGLAPIEVEREMMERGVLPDLVLADLPQHPSEPLPFGHGSQPVQLSLSVCDLAFLAWRVAQSPARWMAKLDVIAIACLESDPWARRWIRLSPRYFGRSLQGQRALGCNPAEAIQIIKGFTTAVEDGTIGTEVAASITIGADTKMFRLPPAQAV